MSTSAEIIKLQTEVEQLQRDVADLKADVKALLALANQSRGGFWVGMVAASSFGAVISWVVSHWPFK